LDAFLLSGADFLLALKVEAFSCKESDFKAVTKEDLENP